jgi:hypothetical protein
MLDIILLVIPLAIMAFNYITICSVLSRQKYTQINGDFIRNKISERQNAHQISSIIISGDTNEVVNDNNDAVNNVFVTNNAVKRHITYTREGFVFR